MTTGNGKIFISYSRASDSQFALKLANDLKNAGVDIWLDQLDIPGGAKWDRFIEQALRNAGSVIIVLSPVSVESDNVMNEVSFALDKKKTVIPLLLAPCEIPLIVYLIHRIDFTGEYKKGLDDLLRTLNVREKKITSPQKEAEIKPVTVEKIVAGVAIAKTNELAANGNNENHLFPENEENATAVSEKFRKEAQQYFTSRNYVKAKADLRAALYYNPLNNEALLLKKLLDNKLQETDKLEIKSSRRIEWISAILALIAGFVFMEALGLFKSQSTGGGSKIPAAIVIWPLYYVFKYLLKGGKTEPAKTPVNAVPDNSDMSFTVLTGFYQQRQIRSFEQWIKILIQTITSWNPDTVDIVSLEQAAINLKQGLELNIEAIKNSAGGPKIIQLLEKGARLGGGNCIHLLGMVYSSGLFGVSIDEELAKRYLTKAKQKGILEKIEAEPGTALPG